MNILRASLLMVAGTLAYSAELGPSFSNLYQVTDLGSVSGVPTPYSSLIFESGKPNILLLGGAATDSAGKLYAVPVTRNAATNHVTSLGLPTPFANTPNIDGGLIYAPNGDLLFTEYGNNQIGEIKPGSTNPDKTVKAPTTASTGSFAIVPQGFPGAGNLTVDAVNSSEFCASSLSEDGQGTYNVSGCSATVTGSGKAEGIIYVPTRAPGFSGQMMLVAEFAANQVIAYAVDPHGLPMLSGSQLFITGIEGAQGAAIDPVTGDFFFSTFSGNGKNEVFVVSAIPQGPTPTVTAVVNADSASTTLCPGLVANLSGTNFGTDYTKASVTVSGKPAYVYPTGFSATQFTVQLPFEASQGPASLVVTIGGTSSSPFNVILSAASPAFLTQSNAPSLANVTSTAGTTVTPVAPAHPGDTVVAYAVGLGATSPATPTGIVAMGVANPVSPLPTVTVGGANAAVSSAGVRSALQPGVYQVGFKLPDNAQGTTPLVITAGGQSSPATTDIAVAGTSAVANNASFANPGTIAPGSIASLFANDLGTASTNETAGVFPSTSAEGVQVTFITTGGSSTATSAPLFHVVPQASPQQVDLFVPDNLPTSGIVNVQLTTSTTTYPNYTLHMVPASPGLYRFTDPKTNAQFAIAQFANSAWLVLPASTTTNLGLPACTASTNALVQCGEPASVGDYLVLYLTGLGLATPNGDPAGKPLPNGQNPPADGSVLYETPTLPTVTIGGIGTKVLFSGLAPGFAGEYQIDVQVPAGVASGDNIPVQVTMLGLSDTAFVSIQASRVKPPAQ